MAYIFGYAHVGLSDAKSVSRAAAGVARRSKQAVTFRKDVLVIHKSRTLCRHRWGRWGTGGVRAVWCELEVLNCWIINTSPFGRAALGVVLFSLSNGRHSRAKTLARGRKEKGGWAPIRHSFSATTMSPPIHLQSYSERAAKHPNAAARQLLETIQRKQSNLCVSVDVTAKADFIAIVDVVGPFVCMVKAEPRPSG
jgi:hypothetical protein